MIIAALALLCISAYAGDESAASLSELVAENPNVVRGTVLRTTSWRDGDAYATKYTIAIFHQLRGQGPEMINTTLPGGTIRGRTQRSAHIPVWQEGDIVVLFLDDKLNVAMDGMFTVDGNLLVDPIANRAGSFPDLYTELTSDLRQVAVFSQLPRERALRLPKIPLEAP